MLLALTTTCDGVHNRSITESGSIDGLLQSQDGIGWHNSELGVISTKCQATYQLLLEYKGVSGKEAEG